MTDTDDEQDRRRHLNDQRKVWRLQEILKGLQIALAVARPKDVTADVGEDLRAALESLGDMTGFIHDDIGDYVDVDEAFEELRIRIDETHKIVKDRFPNWD